jgi:hypothetical protein
VIFATLLILKLGYGMYGNECKSWNIIAGFKWKAECGESLRRRA